MISDNIMSQGPNVVGGAIERPQEYWDIERPTYVRQTGTDSSNFVKLYQSGGYTPSISQQDFNFKMSDLNSYYLPSQSHFEITFDIQDDTLR